MDLRTPAIALALVAHAWAAPAVAPQEAADGRGAPDDQGAGDGQAEEAPAPGGPPELRPYLPQTEREALLALKFCDCYLAVVGDELITQDEVARLASDPDNLEVDPAADDPDAPKEEKRRKRQEQALGQIVEQRLKSEGGQNLGYDPVLVEQMTTRFYEGQIARMGGPAAAGPQLSEFGFTPLTFKAYLGEQLYRRSWESAQTGDGPGPAGRPIADAYVRPGQIYSIYRDIVDEGGPGQRALIGETPAQATLRSFFLPVPAPGEQEATRERAEAVRFNIIEGIVTFDQALNELAPPGLRSGDQLLRTLPVESLAERLMDAHGAMPGVDEFVEGISVGDLSPVMEGRVEGRLNFFVIYRVDRVEAATERLPFTDPGVQERLTEKLREARDELRIERGLARLARSTFVLPDVLRRSLLQRGRSIGR